MTTLAKPVAAPAIPPRLPEEFDPGAEFELKTKGRYQICMELASGGMGSVYLALYRGLDGFERVVALKRMHDHLSSQPRFVEMFFNEAQALARVQHPGVCALIDLGIFNGSHFLAMDYLEGEAFSAIYKAMDKIADEEQRERMPRILARVCARLCDALHAVHETCDEQGKLLHLVHCDVSPQNMFVLYDGTVRLMDFGVARARDMLNQSGTGSDHGKLPYMAPEQLDGIDPDRRCDVWAMGVVMWEMLCGMPLFDGRSMSSVAQEVLNKRIPLASSINPRVPDALAGIVARALVREPERRYQSARELGNALESFLGQISDSVPAGQVAAWLDRLFPGRAGDLRGMRAMARAIGDQLAPPSAHPTSELPMITGAPMVSTSPAVEAMRSKTIQLSSIPAQDEPLPPPKHRPNASVLGAGALFALLAIGGAWLIRPSPKPTAKHEPAAAAPVTKAAPPPSAAPATVAMSPPPSAAAINQPPPPTAAVNPAPPAMNQPPPAAAVANQPPAATASAPTETTPSRSSESLAAAPRPADAPTPPPMAAKKEPAAVAPRPAIARPTAVAPVARRRAPETEPSTPTPAPMPTMGQGSVYVLTSPGPADVVWQGRMLGRTPLRVRLPAGDHTLQLTPASGGPAAQVVVHVEEGSNSFASVKLGG